MTKKLLLFFTASILSTAAIAQSIADINSPKIMPPSPEAAALGKYAQIPVDKATGVPGISIPIYDIKTPRFTLPVSLSYHASGIKVDETAPWTGIGWSLNAGGAVTRSMVGIADDTQGVGFYTNPTTLPTTQQLYMNFHADSTYIQQVAQNLQDSQPDNFFYNFADKSGGFVFGTDKKPILIPYKPLKITFAVSTVNAPSSFTIVDEKGDTYFFNDNETSYNPNIWGLTGVSTWYLTKMISADKSDTIKFYYKQDPGVFSDNSYSTSQNVGPQDAPTNATSVWNMVYTTNTARTQQIHLDSIVFQGGKVAFTTKNGRKDNGYVALDSVIVSNYDYNKRKYNRLKSFKLQTDYFYSSLNNPPSPANYNTDSVSRYRLKLVGLTENDANNAAVKSHQFSYNATMLPPVHNFGQDNWGYYNGRWNNQSLLQSQQITGYFGSSFSPVVYNIGGTPGSVDRSVSAASMQAGVLQQVTYPTGGYTIFNYEPNQYMAPAITTYTATASSVGVYRNTSLFSFTPTQYALNQNNGQLIFHIHITPNSNVSNSYVQILKASDNSGVYRYNGTSSLVDTDIPVALTAGTQYILMAVSIDNVDQTYNPSLPVSAISTTYQDAGAPLATNVGGLRVKSIKNYDSNGVIISTETYKYGLNESGGGDFLTNAGLITNHTHHLYSYGNGQAPIDTYSSNSVYPLSSMGGSPVAYSWVTVYHGDTVQNIGKSIYNYTIAGDSILLYQSPFSWSPFKLNANTAESILDNYYFSMTAGSTNTGQQGLKPVPLLWKNGEPVSEAHYRNNGNGQYLLEQLKATDYKLFYRTGGRGLSIQYLLEGLQTTNQWVSPNDFIFYDYPISGGSRQPMRTITTNYANDGVTVLTKDTTKYFYDNLNHMFPTRILSYNGKGDSLQKQINYPQDMVNAGKDPTGIYASMVTANMISPTVEFIESKNGMQTMKSKTNDSTFNGNLIKPNSVELQNLANPSEVRLRYYAYDAKGNVRIVGKAGAPKAAYVWGYNQTLPVAQATNAAANDIFYDSFEEGDGNSAPDDDHTGHYSHIGSYNHTFSSLDNGAYTLIYWKKSGQSWLLQTIPVTVTSGSYSFSTNDQLDDIRFYPAAAQMSTYTYDPLVGVTSITDAKGETIYYEYDGFQRLMNIRDKDRSIVKSFCYNYAGQQTSGCFIKLPNFRSGPQNGYFRTSCDSTSTGSLVYYSVPAGAYTSNISIQDADNKALAQVNIEGQTYADLNGTCTINAAFYVSNNTGTAYYITFTQGTDQLTFNIPSTGSATLKVPIGTYAVSVYPAGSGQPTVYRIDLTNQTEVNAPRANYAGINITVANPLTLSISNQ